MKARENNERPVSRYKTSLAGHALEAMDAEEAEGESWLISYLDTLTLLLTMFVVLLTFADFSNPANSGTSLVAPVEETTTEDTQPSPDVSELGGQLIDGLDDSVQVVVQKNRINLVINDRILFATAEAQLRPEGLNVLLPLIPILNANQHNITVEGHTDNIPIATSQFPSNWELASSRAASVVRYLQHHGIDASRLSATGYADTRPLKDNDSAEGRAANRRVEIVIHVGGK